MSVRSVLILLGCLLACSACGKRQKTTSELLADLKGKDERDRLIAVRLLPQQRGDTARIIPALIEALNDPESDIRRSAAIGLGSLGEQAKEAIPALQAAQRDRDVRVREAAGKAISRIDSTPAPKSNSGKGSTK